MSESTNKRKLSNASADPAGAQVDTKKAKTADPEDKASALAPIKPEIVEEEVTKGDEETAVDGKDDPEGKAEETHYFSWGEALESLMENSKPEHSIVRGKEHIMEAYALGDEYGVDFDNDDDEAWYAEPAEDDEDGTPFTSTHAKRFVELYKAKDKEANERQAKKELKNTWWWVLTYTKREPMGDVPRIKISFGQWEKPSHERWLIDLEVATDEEDEAMYGILGEILS
ncbi:hypothetical protein FIBSPDRAFT_866075 [Athelia psychrophila]|uniref:Uncharacterized protein n=1 Tax=Athelia psychrophila TaxID=1759441 RepID=A0A166EY52_9AGAM|nr:hypothetical protein FIBSPDRAFT_866075 [Fibularhizoctonia sp. CBS 109695]